MSTNQIFSIKWDTKKGILRLPLYLTQTANIPHKYTQKNRKNHVNVETEHRLSEIKHSMGEKTVSDFYVCLFFNF